MNFKAWVDCRVLIKRLWLIRGLFNAKTYPFCEIPKDSENPERFRGKMDKVLMNYLIIINHGFII